MKKFLTHIALSAFLSLYISETLYGTPLNTGQNLGGNDEVAEKIKKIAEQISLNNKDWVTASTNSPERSIIININNNYSNILETQIENNDDEKYPDLKPQQPRKLIAYEKRISPEKRIAEKIIGEMPDPAKEFISALVNYKKYKKIGYDPCRLLLVYGDPGSGKTYPWEIVAQELEIPIFLLLASSFSDKYIGESSKKIRWVFNYAKQYKKQIIIFIDEIDKMGRKDDANAHEEYQQMMANLLKELQDLDKYPHIFFVAATNYKDRLSDALYNRLLNCCEIPYPTKEDRTKLATQVILEKQAEVMMNKWSGHREFVRDIIQNTYNNYLCKQEIETIVINTLTKTIYTAFNINFDENHLIEREIPSRKLEKMAQDATSLKFNEEIRKSPNFTIFTQRLAEIIHYAGENTLTKSEIFYIYNTVLNQMEKMYSEDLDKQEYEKFATSMLQYFREAIEQIHYNAKDEAEKERLQDAIFQIQRLTADEIELLFKETIKNALHKVIILRWGDSNLMAAKIIAEATEQPWWWINSSWLNWYPKYSYRATKLFTSKVLEKCITKSKTDHFLGCENFLACLEKAKKENSQF